MRFAVGVDGRLQFCQVSGRGLGDLMQIMPVLVGIGLQVGAVAVKDPSADQAVFDGLFHDGVEDLLLDAGAGKAPAPVLGERGGIGHLVGQSQAEKPPVGDIDLYFPHQLALRANAEEVADEKNLEEHHRVEGRATVIGAIQMGRLLPDEIKPNVSIDQTQKMVCGTSSSSVTISSSYWWGWSALSMPS